MTNIKLLSVIEATTVTGPAQVLLEFYRSACEVQPTGAAESAPSHEGTADKPGAAGLPRVNTSIVTFHRRRSGESFRPSAKAPNHFVAVAREAGLKVNVVAERFRFDLRVLRALRSLVARYQPDIIETHHVKSHFLIRLSGLWRQRPWIAYHHGYTMTDLKMDLYNQLDRWSLRSADRIITVSNAAAEDLSRLGIPRDKISALHHAISPEWNAKTDPAAVQALRAEFGLKDEEPVLLAVGRLSREKGHLDLVTAFGRLKQAHPGLNVRLIIVGDGPERPGVEQAIETFQIGQQVTLAGQRNDVRAFYALAKAMVLPSLSEGSPIVLLEAMAARVPVVATAVGGIPEIVTDGESALLVEARHPDAWAGALHRILTDTQLAHDLAARAREVVLEHHSPAANLRARLAIYQDVLSQR